MCLLVCYKQVRQFKTSVKSFIKSKLDIGVFRYLVPNPPETPVFVFFALIISFTPDLKKAILFGQNSRQLSIVTKLLVV